MNENDDTSRFTIRDEEEAPDALYVSDAENLRIEKLSTRVTLVAVLIPCLLVVVLAIAYLDIKNRVVSTRNTGSMGVQNLSKELESRFSSLSLKQAKVEERLEEIAKSLETATAALQVNLKKATTKLDRTVGGKADKTALQALSKKMDASVASIGGLQKEVADLSAAVTEFDDELSGQVLRMAEGLKKDQDRLTQMENKAHQLETEKLSKESMELTLGLERLSLQEMVKDKVRGIEKKLLDLNKRMDALKLQMKPRAAKPPPAPQAAPTSQPPTPATKSDNSSNLTEQTIN
jgi:hypothetical protein